MGTTTPDRHLGDMRPGNSFGDQALINGGTVRSAAAVAPERVEILRLTRDGCRSLEFLSLWEVHRAAPMVGPGCCGPAPGHSCPHHLLPKGRSALVAGVAHAYRALMELARPDLTPDQCWELLTVAHVGRLALSVRALPMIFPVRYAVDGDSVAISLGRHGLPTASVHDAVVAFAVDEIDPSAGVGWMVQMQGRARLFDTDQAPVDPEPAPGAQVVRLIPGTVTGSRFTFPPYAGTPLAIP